MKSLIFGGLGQDGSFLAERLADSHEVVVIHRRENFVGKDSRLRYEKSDITRASIESLIKREKPDVVYNFAGVSNVFDPWDNISDVVSLNLGLPALILSSIKTHSAKSKFIQASSSLVFGSSHVSFCNEESERSPLTPYGVTKNAADQLVKESREVHGLNVYSVILFNHESERRASTFFTRKVIDAAIKISKGERSTLSLGSLDSHRDMGFAWDYMDAVDKIARTDEPEDFVIGTGKLVGMRDFVKEVFECFDLDYRNFVIEKQDDRRNNNVNPTIADASKMRRKLGWKAQEFSTQLLVDRIIRQGEVNARAV